MRVERSVVARWLEYHPQYRSRKMMRLGVLEYVTSVLGEKFTLDHVQMANLVLRRMQELIPNDQKGIELEAEYRDTEMGMASIVELATKALTPPGYVRRDGHLFKII